MPSYTVLPTSTESMIIVDITHDDKTVRTNVGFIVGTDLRPWKDVDDLQKQLSHLVQANQDTHYALKDREKAKASLTRLIGKPTKVERINATSATVGR